eukprot:Blabericola_migrator_1__23@NODE_1006_length_5721_cov_24_862575_g414_i2_p3_GENE_NODE_1006_length_5721_cov_24_862575_g414_i2NODE_1006_length_5721_cov_24_862575_g414_i2_p3_ORF_typecomplete_len140_score13_89_NODE_1006_length_5721_cov_24_862575_g414_i2465884
MVKLLLRPADDCWWWSCVDIGPLPNLRRVSGSPSMGRDWWSLTLVLAVGVTLYHFWIVFGHRRKTESKLIKARREFQSDKCNGRRLRRRRKMVRFNDDIEIRYFEPSDEEVATQSDLEYPWYLLAPMVPGWPLIENAIG